ncbi:Abortive infection protein [Parvibaculum lavamentivorans DS-1]|uniref:Abortive infection protein n=1 Tax=Parvibaculum lavamentivorans (strain DS-1 / DSM 13023 / NCIMB 13966) TaxID=402881 RepID=A7HUC8_PARL1|nr:CPBP family intramembrane glutamic endopeptidase [Parvibaculum lavamentivorans]ABS63511.1 Abortive infection protein [Parvibaculum lavamentivorans DS-1]
MPGLEEEPASRPPHSWWDIVAVPLLAMAMAAVAAGGAALLYVFMQEIPLAELRETATRAFRSTYVVYGAQAVLYLAIVFSVWVVLALRGYRLLPTHFAATRARSLLAAVAIGAMLAILAVLLLSLLPEDTQRQLVEGSELLMPETVGEALMLLVIAALLAPLVEELYFRGIVLRVLEGRFSFAVAAAITAVFFTLMHGHLFNLPGLGGWVLTGVIFILGMVLAWSVRWSGSLRPAIAMHAAYNFTLLAPGMAAMLTGVQT